jgi:hypothetical protein
MKLFYTGLAGLAFFEILRVYLIMPMPGSQRIESLDAAYLLHTWCWGFRILFGLAIAAGSRAAFQVSWKWRGLPVLLMLLVAAISWMFNFQLTAESMFKEPGKLAFQPRVGNVLDEGSLVIGVEHNGEARAYPIRFLVYHHQVRDTVGGKPVLITYCSVCRTGRVYEPVVNGQQEKFRLVGMDHFNALFEDATTGSWWRQTTGEAVTGRLKGTALPEVPASQLTLAKWFALHPAATVMQPDEASLESYDTEGRFERGESRGELTRTDSASWKDKSWVVGVRIATASKAYAWNQLKERRIINDMIGQTPIVLVLAADQQSFAAFERPGEAEHFTLQDAGARSPRGLASSLSLARWLGEFHLHHAE